MCIQPYLLFVVIIIVIVTPLPCYNLELSYSWVKMLQLKLVIDNGEGDLKALLATKLTILLGIEIFEHGL